MFFCFYTLLVVFFLFKLFLSKSERRRAPVRYRTAAARCGLVHGQMVGRCSKYKVFATHTNTSSSCCLKSSTSQRLIGRSPITCYAKQNTRHTSTFASTVYQRVLSLSTYYEGNFKLKVLNNCEFLFIHVWLLKKTRVEQYFKQYWYRYSGHNSELFNWEQKIIKKDLDRSKQILKDKNLWLCIFLIN